MGVEYLRYLASKWVFLATAIAAAIVTSLLGSAIVTKQYTATATLLIEPGAGFDPRAATAVSAMYLESLKTYEEFAASDSLFLRACDKFHLEHGAIESFKRKVLRVTKPRDTKLLQISVTLPEAKSAQAMAEFLATETVALNHSIADQGDQKLLQDFQTKRESTRTSLDQLRTEMSALTSSAQDATLETEARNLADLKTRLEEQRIDAAAYAAEAANREDRERTSANARLSSLTTETAKVARDADSAAAKLAAFRTRRERLSERLHIAEEAYDVARKRADEFEAASQMRSDQLRIVDPGIVPQRPSYPNKGVAIVGASILALVASVGWLTWRRS